MQTSSDSSARATTISANLYSYPWICRTIDRARNLPCMDGERCEATRSQEGRRTHDPIENFNVLNSLLRGCLCLEELVLELLFKQEKNPLGVNGESTENHKGPANISRIQAKREMEMVIRELPAMRRYVVLGLDSGIMRRNPGQPWTHQCPPVRYGDICHFYEPYDTTCFGDSVDLLTNLRPTARKSWVSLS
jgi:hypothetical protein